MPTDKTGRKRRPTSEDGRGRQRSLRRTTSYTPGGIVISKWTRIRFSIVGACITLAFMGIGYRAYGLQVRDGEHFGEMAARQHVRTIEVPAPRGVIFDRNGVELAVNAQVESVFANPRAVSNLVASAEAIATALDLDVREVEGRLASKRYFTWLKRHVTPKEAKAVRALGIEGIDIAHEPRRYYPGKALAGHVLGFAGIDGNGLDGLELALDEVLAGKQAKMAALRDASGGVMVDDPHARPQRGASVTLTIDRSVQYAAERAIRKAVEDHKAKAAVAVVTDIKTGDVLAIASYPEVDPNAPGTAKQDGARNRALTDSYEVGSVMKVFTIAAALELGVVNPSTIIDVEKGRWRQWGKTFTDSFHDEELSVGGVIKRSSNVGAVKIGHMIGAEPLRAYFRKLGFGETTGIELPGEVAGVLHPSKRWGDLGLATHSFGYGMTSTPLQVTAAMATIGNGGVYNPPRIIRNVVDGDGRVLYERTTQGKQVIDKDVCDSMIPMLESVFEGGKEHGTARSLFVPGQHVGGKTGTAHKIDPETHTYADDLYLASFSGIAPSRDPKIAVTVLVDEPHGEEHYGGQVAGPAWTQIVGETLAILGAEGNDALLVEQLDAKMKRERRKAWIEGINYDKIQREKRRNRVPLTDMETLFAEESVEDAELEPLEPAAEPSGPQVPDFTGLSIAKALDLARKHGLRLEVVGSGWAVDQSPTPGAQHDPGTIRVVFTSSEHALAGG